MPGTPCRRRHGNWCGGSAHCALCGYLFAYTRTGKGQLVSVRLAALVVVAELVRPNWEKQLRHKNDGEEVEQKQLQ